MDNPIKLCSFPECGRTNLARGLCAGHYQQIHRGEELRPMRRRVLSAGRSVRDRFDEQVDKSGACHVWTGTVNKGGYGLFASAGREVLAHRKSFELKNGPVPSGMQIDHTCYTRACVNPDHLRAVSHKENQENRAGINRDNRSGYRGVYFNKQNKRWHARVKHNNKDHHVGYFDNVHEAGAAARARRMELYTHSDGR